MNINEAYTRLDITKVDVKCICPRDVDLKTNTVEAIGIYDRYCPIPGHAEKAVKQAP